MIRHFFSSLLYSDPTGKTQAVAITSSLFLGLGIVLLASAFIQHTDQAGALPRNDDRLFQVEKWLVNPNGERLPTTKTAGLLAPALATRIPEIEAVTRFMSWPEEVLLGNMERNEATKRWAFADGSFPRVFDLDFLQGNAATALTEPGEVVLTEAVARKLFGTAEALDKTVIGLGGKTYRVSGVVRNPSKKSVVQYDVLASWTSTEENSGLHYFPFLNNWIGQTVETYVLLRNPDEASAVESRLSDVLRKQATGQPGQYSFFLEPIRHQSAKSGR